MHFVAFSCSCLYCGHFIINISTFGSYLEASVSPNLPGLKLLYRDLIIVLSLKNCYKSCCMQVLSVSNEKVITSIDCLLFIMV